MLENQCRCGNSIVYVNTTHYIEYYDRLHRLNNMGWDVWWFVDKTVVCSADRRSPLIIQLQKKIANIIDNHYDGTIAVCPACVKITRVFIKL